MSSYYTPHDKSMMFYDECLSLHSLRFFILKKKKNLDDQKFLQISDFNYIVSSLDSTESKSPYKMLNTHKYTYPLFIRSWSSYSSLKQSYEDECGNGSSKKKKLFGNKLQ